MSVAAPNSALAELDRRFSKGRALAVAVPDVDGFRDFMERVARVDIGGEYMPYSFEGRECIRFVCDLIDEVWDSGEEDVTIAACGGAQIGKTILLLHFLCWVTGVEFKNIGYYLPDDGLVGDLVDIKLRPQVIDQQAWFAQMIALGKTLSESGKAVNKKGAFLVTDGIRNAIGMIRGMKKFPTTFSMDVAIEDEKDDIPPHTSRYIAGRMTSSDRRLRFSIGTQRYDGAGQNKEFEDGTQHIGFLMPARSKRSAGKTIELSSSRLAQASALGSSEGLADNQSGGTTSSHGGVNPESNWPDVVRLQLGRRPSKNDPKLTYTGDFVREVGKRGERQVFPFNRESGDGGQVFYLADPQTGAVLDRKNVQFIPQRPDRIATRKFSVRCSQLVCSGLSLRQMVSRWQDAVKDAFGMETFCCDVLAMPKSTAQQLSARILQRSREVDPYDMSLTGASERGGPKFGGLDTGNTCWLWASEVTAPDQKRLRWAEAIPVAEMVTRTEELFHLLGLNGLMIDAHPETAQARQLALRLNGLDEYDFRELPKNVEGESWNFGDGLAWDEDVRRWRGLRCAVVEFTKARGAGVVHKIGRDPSGGIERLFPIIQVNRFEAISAAIHQLLTPEEGVQEMIEGAGEDSRRLRERPAMQLPRRELGGLSILEKVDEHLLTGSKRAVDDASGEMGDYVDKCQNHLLLGAAYARLAETIIGGTGNEPVRFAYQPIDRKAGRGRGGNFNRRGM